MSISSFNEILTTGVPTKKLFIFTSPCSSLCNVRPWQRWQESSKLVTSTVWRSVHKTHFIWPHFIWTEWQWMYCEVTLFNMAVTNQIRQHDLLHSEATANWVISYHRWVQMKWGQMKQDEMRDINTHGLKLVINQLCQPQRIACWTVPHPINWPVQKLSGTLHNTSSTMPGDQCHQHLSLYRHQRLLSPVSQQKDAAA